MPFPGDTLLEFQRIGDEKAVQEWTRVEPGGDLPLSGRDRFLEFRDVAGDDGRIETQIVHAREDRILTELAMNRIQHLRERVASGLCVALRPEQRDDLVSGETAVPCHGKDAE